MIRALPLSLVVVVVLALPLGFATRAHADEPPATTPSTATPAGDAFPERPAADPLASDPQPSAAPPIDVERKLNVNDLPPPSIGTGELLGPLFKTLFMLGVVLAVVYLTLHKGLGKLVQRQNMGRRVKVVERVSLDPKRALYLVEIDGRQMLLGSGDNGGVVHIRDVTPPGAPLAPVGPTGQVGALVVDKPKFADALAADTEKKIA